MKCTFDEDKNKINIEKHGFSLDTFELLDLETALFEPDLRKDYGERRILVFAYLQRRLCTAVVTVRSGAYRVISFRKSNAKERKKYEEEK